MTAKEWLQRGRTINKELEALLEAQRRAFALTCKVTSSYQPDRIQRSVGNITEKNMVQYAAFSKEIDQRVKELYIAKREILNAINEVQDTRHQMILLEHYVNCKTFEQIAHEQNYSSRHIFRIHKKALSAVAQRMSLNVI